MDSDHRTQFDTYRIRYATGGDETPTVDCFHRGELVGTLAFHPDGASSSANRLEHGADGGTVLHLIYELGQFADVIAILREEKPLYLTLSESTLAGAVMTGQEPVGESEPYLSR